MSLTSWLAPLLQSAINFMGLDDARFAPSDWSFKRNPFWTSYLLTLIIFPCAFYLTWFLNRSLSKNRLGLSWVTGFYSALLFTIAGLYEVPHLRTVFNSIVDYQPAVATASLIVAPTTASTAAALTSSLEIFDFTGVAAAATSSSALMDVCYPLLKSGGLALVATLPSFLRLDTGSHAKYYCFSDLDYRSSNLSIALATALNFSAATSSYSESENQQAQEDLVDDDTHGSPQNDHRSHNNYGRRHPRITSKEGPISLRHRVFQGQMQRPHLAFSLENYPDDGRIGPHIIAGNFQAFLLVDLVLGFIHYRKKLEPFSTVFHHIIYYFIVVHMRAGDMLSVFCICGTPIEASSIFLAFGRIFPHHRTPAVERLYLFSFISTRLFYVAFLWHEIFFNYPDKSVAMLYTITLSLHVYWFVMYIQTQRRFQAKQRREDLRKVLQSLASAAEEDYVSKSSVENGKDGLGSQQKRASVEIEERGMASRDGAQEI